MTDELLELALQRLNLAGDPDMLLFDGADNMGVGHRLGILA
jgi:hypothetical protein